MGRGWLGAAGAGKAGDRSVLGIDSRLMLYRLLCVGEWILGRWWSHVGTRLTCAACLRHLVGMPTCCAPCGHAYLQRCLPSLLPLPCTCISLSHSPCRPPSPCLTYPTCLTLSHLPYLPHLTFLPACLTIPASPLSASPCLPHTACLLRSTYLPALLTLPSSLNFD